MGLHVSMSSDNTAMQSVWWKVAKVIERVFNASPALVKMGA